MALLITAMQFKNQFSTYFVYVTMTVFGYNNYKKYMDFVNHTKGECDGIDSLWYFLFVKIVDFQMECMEAFNMLRIFSILYVQNPLTLVAH